MAVSTLSLAHAFSLLSVLALCSFSRPVDAQMQGGAGAVVKSAGPAPSARQIDKNLWVGGGAPFLLLKIGEPPAFDRQRVVLMTCKRWKASLPADCLRYFDTGRAVGKKVSFKESTKRVPGRPGFVQIGILTIDGRPSQALWRDDLRGQIERGPLDVVLEYDERYPLYDFQIRFPGNVGTERLCCEAWLAHYTPEPAWAHAYFVDLAKLDAARDPLQRFEGMRTVAQWPGIGIAYIRWRSAVAVIDTSNGELLSKNSLVRTLPIAELKEIERAASTLLFPKGLLTPLDESPWRIWVDDDYEGPTPGGGIFGRMNVPGNFSIELDNRWNEDEIVEGDAELGRHWLNEVQRRLAERFK